MTREAAPERIRWTVELMSVAATDRLLEIGCGGGVAVALTCPLLSTGSITAIDRSATMTARARQRNSTYIHAGRADIRTAAFRPAELSGLGLDNERFDKIFAINVNLFWTRPATEELALVHKLLAPGGGLYLCYDPPGDRATEIAGRVTSTLAASGFTAETVRSASTVGIIGRPASAV